MRKYVPKLIPLIFIIIISGNIFSQTKIFLVNVNQPPKEQCIINEISRIVESQLKIFPNPSKGEITISFGEKMRDSKVDIQVFSLDGRILFSSEEYLERSSLQKRIDLSSLSKGIYLMKISGKEFCNNQRIVLY
jgi:hypothetical protein